MDIPDFTKNSVFHDAELKDYLPESETIEINKNPEYIFYCEAAQSCFFQGGKLEDHGLTPKIKPSGKLYKAIQVLLRSFAPSHGQKIGTVAKLLKEHCDKI